MKKICLSVIGLYCMLLSAFGQSDTSYHSKKLTFSEANIVTGYYNQTGDHSAVTGGIGTEKLTNLSNIIDLEFVKWDEKNNKYTWTLGLGIDYHTSASQAYVSETGASRADGTRIYPAANWEVEKSNGLILGVGVFFSNEYNYKSRSVNFEVGKISKNKNTEINFKGQAFFDEVKMIEPSELRPKTAAVTGVTYTTASGNTITAGGESHGPHIPSSPRNTYAGSLTISQVVNKSFQASLIIDGVAQTGYLGLPFHRVYFKDLDSAKIEKLPDTRFKLPVGVRLNYFIGDKVILRSYYRYYHDNWGITANTASLEVPYKVSAFFSISPFYRYYTQSASTYFAPYQEHSVSDPYYTSNYVLSAFSAQYVGVNFKITPKRGIFNIPFFNTVELRYGRYWQTTGLQANNIAINLKFK
jgi:hypothetical protein